MQARANLKRIARTQRLLVWVFGGLLGVQLLALLVPLPLTNQAAMVSLTVVTLMVVAQLVGMAVVYGVARSCGIAPIAAAVCASLMISPCLNLLVVFAFHMQAIALLRAAGIRAGVLGVSREQLRLLDEGRCRSCGYDMTGLDGVRCPECGRTSPLAA